MDFIILTTCPYQILYQKREALSTHGMLKILILHCISKVCFIASTFNTTSDYLYGLTDDPNPSTITISSSEDPELFSFVNSLQKDNSLEKRLLEYFNKLTQQKNERKKEKHHCFSLTAGDRGKLLVIPQSRRERGLHRPCLSFIIPP